MTSPYAFTTREYNSLREIPILFASDSAEWKVLSEMEMGGFMEKA